MKKLEKYLAKQTEKSNKKAAKLAQMLLELLWQTYPDEARRPEDEELTLYLSEENHIDITIPAPPTGEIVLGRIKHIEVSSVGFSIVVFFDGDSEQHPFGYDQLNPDERLSLDDMLLVGSSIVAHIKENPVVQEK